MVIRKQRTTAQLSIVLTQFIFIFINVVQWNSYSFLNYLFLYQKQRIRTFFTRLGSDFQKCCQFLFNCVQNIIAGSGPNPLLFGPDPAQKKSFRPSTFWSRSGPKKEPDPTATLQKNLLKNSAWQMSVPGLGLERGHLLPNDVVVC